MAHVDKLFSRSILKTENFICLQTDMEIFIKKNLTN